MSSTSGSQVGLRHRLRRVLRQLEDQHRHLGPIFEEICRALRGGAVRDVSAAFERYREALAAHFELEESVFFPAVHGLTRDRGSDLCTLCEDHEAFHAQLEAIREHLRRSELEAGQRALDALTASLRSHEQREEGLVAEVVGDPPARS